MVRLPGPIVSAKWLESHLDDVDVADVRWTMLGGASVADFETGHLPGAVFVDLDADLSDPAGERGRHPLPTAERFARVRSRLGFGDRPVVAYDDAGGSTAGRLWWMLTAIGLPAAVLDGGFAAWPGSLAMGPVTPTPTETPLDVRPWPPDRFLSAEDVLPAIDAGAVALDARSAERFRGEPNPIDPVAGHIPGARSRPWTKNLGPDGRFLAPERLRDEFSDLGVIDGSELVASCGSGVTGCHILLAAAVAGFETGRLYTGSWSEWISSGDRPVAVGPDS